MIQQGMRMPALGIAAGVVASLALTRIMSHLLFGIEATDPLTFAGVAVSLAVVALFACYVAARRGVRIDPIRALRA